MGLSIYRTMLIKNWSFSIRSFGSFDGTMVCKIVRKNNYSFSIRSFGSFDGTLSRRAVHYLLYLVSVSALSDHLMGLAYLIQKVRCDLKFQYPLFRII